MNLLLHKPCFGEMKYNFPIKRFRALSVCQDTLKVYVPLTNLISTNSLDPILYDKMRYISFNLTLTLDLFTDVTFNIVRIYCLIFIWFHLQILRFII
jgi:hypothetical protein